MDGPRNLLQLALVLGSLGAAWSASASADSRAWLLNTAAERDSASPRDDAGTEPDGSEERSPSPAGTLSANGPVRLDGGRSAWAPPEEPHEATTATTPANGEQAGSDRPSRDDRLTGSSTVAETSSGEGVAAPSSNELKPLGRDAGPLRLGTKSSDSGSATESNGLLPAGLSEVLRVGGALAVVVGLLLLFAMLTRRLSGTLRAGRPAGVLEVLARYPVGRGQHLMLLKLDRRVLLVHQSGSNMATLADLREPGEVASLLSRIEAANRESMGGRFQLLLERAGGRFGDGATAGGAAARDGEVETIDLTRSTSARRRLLP